MPKNVVENTYDLFLNTKRLEPKNSRIFYFKKSIEWKNIIALSFYLHDKSYFLRKMIE